MGTIFHVGLDIRGTLKLSNRQLKGLLVDETGKGFTADQVKDELMDKLAEGKRFLPIGKCDNFDFQNGCQGHPSEIQDDQ